MKKQPEKNRSDNKMAAPEASVHPLRNRLCYHFSLYQTNESCSQSVSRRIMWLRIFNKFCFGVTAQMLPRLNGHFINVLAWFALDEDYCYSG